MISKTKKKINKIFNFFKHISILILAGLFLRNFNRIKQLKRKLLEKKICLITMIINKVDKLRKQIFIKIK